jgi:hypothetical protein
VKNITLQKELLLLERSLARRSIIHAPLVTPRLRRPFFLPNKQLLHVQVSTSDEKFCLCETSVIFPPEDETKRRNVNFVIYFGATIAPNRDIQQQVTLTLATTQCIVDVLVCV